MRAPLIQNIWAVGRNFAEHAKEMKSEVPTSPLFFLKAGSCAETSSKIQLPSWSNDIQHELELAFWLDENLNYSHITLALDLTARDAQSLAKSKGQPWTRSKSFKSACPLGSWINLKDVASLETLQFQLVKNKETVQVGHFKDMIFKPDQLLEHVKNFYPVCPHDVILTGTPEGVGPIKSGDTLFASLQSENREIFTCHWDVV
jgi:acylpyruvate hydrolase